MNAGNFSRKPAPSVRFAAGDDLQPVEERGDGDDGSFVVHQIADDDQRARLIFIQ